MVLPPSVLPQTSHGFLGIWDKSRQPWTRANTCTASGVTRYMMRYPQKTNSRMSGASASWTTLPMRGNSLNRSTADKTSTVHFMRFEFDEGMRADWKGGAAVHMGCDHENRPLDVELPGDLRERLAGDFD